MNMEQGNLEDIAYEFFKTFARCEYSLKAAGFLKEKPNRSSRHWFAQPDWKAFAAYERNYKRQSPTPN